MSTAAARARQPGDIVVGSNQWQPEVETNNQDYVGLGPSGFTRCAVWSSQNGGRSWAGGAIKDQSLGPVRSPLHIPSVVPLEFDDPGNVFSAAREQRAPGA